MSNILPAYTPDDVNRILRQFEERYDVTFERYEDGTYLDVYPVADCYLDIKTIRAILQTNATFSEWYNAYWAGYDEYVKQQERHRRHTAGKSDNKSIA